MLRMRIKTMSKWWKTIKGLKKMSVDLDEFATDKDCKSGMKPFYEAVMFGSSVDEMINDLGNFSEERYAFAKEVKEFEYSLSFRDEKDSFIIMHNTAIMFRIYHSIRGIHPDCCSNVLQDSYQERLKQLSKHWEIYLKYTQSIKDQSTKYFEKYIEHMREENSSKIRLFFNHVEKKINGIKSIIRDFESTIDNYISYEKKVSSYLDENSKLKEENERILIKRCELTCRLKCLIREIESEDEYCSIISREEMLEKLDKILHYEQQN